MKIESNCALFDKSKCAYSVAILAQFVCNVVYDGVFVFEDIYQRLQ